MPCRTKRIGITKVRAIDQAFKEKVLNFSVHPFEKQFKADDALCTQ